MNNFFFKQNTNFSPPQIVTTTAPNLFDPFANSPTQHSSNPSEDLFGNMSAPNGNKPSNSSSSALMNVRFNSMDYEKFDY